MSFSRFNAIDTVLNRDTDEIEFRADKNEEISSFYGCNVFNDKAMKAYMPEEIYLKVKVAIDTGNKLTLETANEVANAMKVWAIEKGVTHYAHWFQPLTGKTAEKHDSFFTIDHEGKPFEEFGGKELAQQEPDGSSFPGGGLRSTFEARGYTAWDPSSPAFILEVGEGKTLCIPTIFVTYGGQSLDYKLPLLKSQQFLENASLPVAKLFDKNVTKISATLGWEQEYFVIDEAFYNARPDLVLCGRTLVGKHTPKGQQMDDHYFGSIPERVYNYMRDLETECHKLGIPVRTRHNEVGPGQYELAPMFEEVNIAIDHNQLLMDMMDRIARRHKLRVLMHEKPFDGVNGSGKHNNWSLGTDTGTNLLSPGKNQGKNLRFLTFFMNAIMAVQNNADLLRASVASASNEFRLGANEAPPAIISVFIGEHLTNLLNQIERGNVEDGVEKALNLMSKIPDLRLDNTDRNRTSPFAFTGNKFEFRMAGSLVNCAAPMTILNTIMAKQLMDFKKDVDKFMGEGFTQDEALLKVIKRYIRSTRKIRFEGDNYSDNWKLEAEKRGLNNFAITPLALDAYVDSKALRLFKEGQVFTKDELLAHHDVMLEKYIMTVEIEAQTLEELALNYIIPSGVEYQKSLMEIISNMKEIGMAEEHYVAQLDIAKRISSNISGITASLRTLTENVHKANEIESPRERGIAFAESVKPLMDDVRTYADDLELLVDDKDWSLVKYREMMFIR